MKKKFTFLIALVTLSCSLDDGNDTIEIFNESLPIEAANLPDQFKRNQIYDVTLTYSKPTNCHIYRDLLFKRDINEITIEVLAEKYIQEGVACDSLGKAYETTFKFPALQGDNYMFKFWQGKNDQGEDIYLEIDVPVVN